MDVVFAFAAAIVATRLTAELVRRHRSRPQPGLLAWSAALAAFAIAAAAVAWGAAAGWDDRSFRVYYLFGGRGRSGARDETGPGSGRAGIGPETCLPRSGPRKTGGPGAGSVRGGA